MTTAQRLVLLKKDVQQLTSANDEYLTFLLTKAEAAVNKMGVVDDGSDLYDSILIDYAAYVWRKRDASTAKGKLSETAMPRYLKRNINNLLFSQKIQEGQA